MDGVSGVRSPTPFFIPLSSWDFCHIFINFAQIRVIVSYLTRMSISLNLGLVEDDVSFVSLPPQTKITVYIWNGLIVH